MLRQREVDVWSSDQWQQKREKLLRPWGCLAHLLFLDQVSLAIGLDKSTMRSSQRIVLMLSDMLMSIVIVVAVVVVGLGVTSLGREGLDLHLTKEHFVGIVEVIMRLLGHFREASVVLDDAFGCF